MKRGGRRQRWRLGKWEGGVGGKEEAKGMLFAVGSGDRTGNGRDGVAHCLTGGDEEA